MADAKAIACTLIRQIENISLRAYPDPVTGGEPYTIGFGNTHMPDGSPVKRDSVLPDRAAAEALLLQTLGQIQPKLHQMVHVPLEPCQEGALLSFQYNVGSGALHGSTLLAKLNAGDRLLAAEQFLLWNKGRVHGQLVPIRGLTNRRKLERAVFLGLVDPAGSSPAAARPTLAPRAVASSSADSLNAAELAHVAPKSA